MTLERWHAHGNVYLVGAGPFDAARARAEVGDADGIVDVRGRGEDWVEIVIWNPDGSTAELSGNATRIAAAWIGTPEATVRVGAREVHARRLDDGRIEQALGAVRVVARERIAGLDVAVVDVGNPHAVVEGDPDDLPLIGPLLETHPRFPNRTNVQVAHVEAPGRVRARVWERGAGETSASGTSAVAVAAATQGDGHTVVVFPGGELEVTIADGQATLVGPAERVS